MKSWAAGLAAIAVVFLACGNDGRSAFRTEEDAGGPGGDFGVSDGGGDAPPDGIPLAGDPRTCEEADRYKTYVGCDYWPAVIANPVWSVFDFVAVVANGQEEAVEVTAEGPNGFSTRLTVGAKSVAKVYLPWVAELKGSDFDVCGQAPAFTESVLVRRGAYHLVATKPVTVYQFNALEYQGAGGPPGKSWASCAGSEPCPTNPGPEGPEPIGCFSYSNDASLLLPSTALTGTYRLAGYRGFSAGPSYVQGATAIVVGTQDGTAVEVKLAPHAGVRAGPGIAATAVGGTLSLMLNRGDVAELVAEGERDLSGSLVRADKPVEVIAGVPCTTITAAIPACDHIEESVLPAETLGKQYAVTVPTAPDGKAAPGHVVRLYGNRDGTTLEYRPMRPTGCPASISAGEVVDCGVVDFDFVLTADKELAVGSFMLGGSAVDPIGALGDPSASVIAAVEQYRATYVVLAPDDYVRSFVDVAAPNDTTLKLDGVEVPASSFKPLGSEFTVARLPLAPVGNGIHRIEASNPVGAQLLGYGRYTSYHVPAGLDLRRIVAPPVK